MTKGWRYSGGRGALPQGVSQLYAYIIYIYIYMYKRAHVYTIHIHTRTPTTTPPRAVTMATPIYIHILYKHVRINLWPEGLVRMVSASGARAVFVPASHILSYEYFTGRGSGDSVVEMGGVASPGGSRSGRSTSSSST